MRIVKADGMPGQALTPAGPTVQALIDQTTEGGRLAVTEVVIPPGEVMREHDHGASEALLVPLDGVLAVTSGSQRQDISRGMIVLLDRAEQVQFSNQTSESFTMMVVFTSVPGASAADRGTDVPGEALDEVAGADAQSGRAQWVAVPPGALDQLKDDDAVHVDLAGHPVAASTWPPASLPALRPPSRYPFLACGSPAKASKLPCRHLQRHEPPGAHSKWRNAPRAPGKVRALQHACQL